MTGPGTFHWYPTYHLTAELTISSCLPSNSQDPYVHYLSHRALDLLFKFFTSWCLRIIPDLFLKDMFRALSVPRNQVPPKTPHYSPMLHNAIMALALAFSDEPFGDLKTRTCYANHAKSFIEAECRRPNLSVVHAFSVLATFHNAQGDQTLGFLYFGMTSSLCRKIGC